MIYQGKVHRFGNNIDTDGIIPARYLNTIDPAELARHCLEGVDPEFANRVRPGDIIVAGENFGCGSSREHAPLAIKASGISCVVAYSFARIFFRNAINIGLPVLICATASALAKPGDQLEIDFREGTIMNSTLRRLHRALPHPALILEIVSAGGLISYLRRIRPLTKTKT